MSRKAIIFSLLSAGLAILLAAPARAQTVDKLAYLTFSRSVQVPGVTLTAGTYRFRLADTATSRKVMQVLSYDGSAVYSMFHTTADVRMTTTDEPVATFMETPAGVAPAVRSLFYGGESQGYEFVWWKPVDMTGATTTAPQPVITYTRIPAAVAPQPIEEAVAVEPETRPLPAEPLAEPLVEPVAEPAVAELPRTASAFPLIAFVGLGAMAAGVGARRLRRRLN